MAEQNRQGPDDKRPLDRDLSDAELVAHLERLTGRRIKSRDDISAYVKSLSEQAKQKRVQKQYLKNGLLAGLLAIAALQYYFIDVQLQILSQPTLTVFLPAKGDALWRPSGRS